MPQRLKLCTITGIKVAAKCQLLQLLAIFKHEGNVCQIGRYFKTAQIQFRQAAAPEKHLLQVQHVTRVKATNIQAGQALAVVKHLKHIGNISCIKVTDVQPRQLLTVSEHTLHIGNFAGIKAADIQRLYRFTAAKHIPHVGNFAGIKAADIQHLYRFTAAKHITHVGGIVGDQIAQAIDGGQLRDRCVIIAYFAILEHGVAIRLRIHFRSLIADRGNVDGLSICGCIQADLVGVCSIDIFH